VGKRIRENLLFLMKGYPRDSLSILYRDMKARILFLIILCWLSSCNDKRKATTVTLHFIPYYSGRISLEKLSLEGNKDEILDSAFLDHKEDKFQIEFTIPEQEERVFQLRIGEVRIPFVNDVSSIEIFAKRPDLKEYNFKNPGINTSLKDFIDEQNQQNKTIDDRERSEFSFANSTNSPGVFLFMYKNLHREGYFENKYSDLKEFIEKAAERFPKHVAIQNLKNEIVDFSKVFEEEYNTGDYVPDITLPDQNNVPTHLSSLKGKYLFIDFWSPFCDRCLPYIPEKIKLRSGFPEKKLEIVNIAVNSERFKWMQMIEAKKIPGIHLIDEKFGRNNTTLVFKFDSIPFNFFISPKGKILSKAIPKDSVLPVLSRLIGTN
jgi:thiol-disulfide isomerase/thioredoxin